jgi:hypothetical protein
MLPFPDQRHGDTTWIIRVLGVMRVISNELVWAAQDLDLDEAQTAAVALLALVAGQDVEPSDGPGTDMAIIALGDLNDCPWDASVRFNANSGRERGDTSRAQPARFHNLAWNYLHVDAVDHNGNSGGSTARCTTKAMATHST